VASAPPAVLLSFPAGTAGGDLQINLPSVLFLTRKGNQIRAPRERETPACVFANAQNASSRRQANKILIRNLPSLAPIEGLIFGISPQHPRLDDCSSAGRRYIDSPKLSNL